MLLKQTAKIDEHRRAGEGSKFLRRLKQAAIIVGVPAAALLVWGVFIEPRRFSERWLDVAIPKLPLHWTNRRIAFIADLQVGMWLQNLGTIRRIVGRIVQERPAAVLIAGDFVYKPSEHDQESGRDYNFQEARRAVRTCVETLRPILAAGIPVYAVLGNHDYAMDVPNAVPAPALAEMVRTALEQAGIVVLQNQSEVLRSTDEKSGGEPLYVCGIGPEYPGRDDVEKAMARVPMDACRIVVMHNPVSFKKIPAGAAPLALAGHTHGSQVRLPGLPDFHGCTLSRTRTSPSMDGPAPITVGPETLFM